MPPAQISDVGPTLPRLGNNGSGGRVHLVFAAHAPECDYLSGKANDRLHGIRSIVYEGSPNITDWNFFQALGLCEPERPGAAGFRKVLRTLSRYERTRAYFMSKAVKAGITICGSFCDSSGRLYPEYLKAKQEWERKESSAIDCNAQSMGSGTFFIDGKPVSNGVYLTAQIIKAVIAWACFVQAIEDSFIRTIARAKFPVLVTTGSGHQDSLVSRLRDTGALVTSEEQWSPENAIDIITRKLVSGETPASIPAAHYEKAWMHAYLLANMLGHLKTKEWQFHQFTTLDSLVCTAVLGLLDPQKVHDILFATGLNPMCDDDDGSPEAAGRKFKRQKAEAAVTVFSEVGLKRKPTPQEIDAFLTQHSPLWLENEKLADIRQLLLAQ